MFREGFQGDFSGVSGAVWRGFITYFHGKIFGKRRGRREWKWRRGGGRGEEKLKSAYGKNEFCDHIVFLQNPVFGEM